MSARRPPWETPTASSHLAAPAWADADSDDRLATIEADVTRLIRELATARADLTTQEARQRQELEQYLLALLEVADGFQRVFENIQTREPDPPPAQKAWIGNFRTVSRLLSRALEQQGVSPIEIPTQRFDPQWHTAAEAVINPTLAPGTIVEEIKRGYVWQGRPLRKTEVVVVREGGGRG